MQLHKIHQFCRYMLPGRWAPTILTVMCSISISILSCVGCQMLDANYRQKIQSEDPVERVRAVIHAGEIRDSRAVPLLVDRLDDEDEAVRVLAIVSLKKITGQDLGYYYYQPLVMRSVAVERWRGWLAEQSADRKGGVPESQVSGSR